MENKKFLTSFLVFFIALMMYNQFYAAPKAAKAKAAATAQEQAQEAPAVATSGPVSPAKNNQIATPAVQSVKEELYPFSTATADIVFTSKGAGIKDYVFKDCVGDINLTPYLGEGFYTTFPNVNFTQSAKTADSITFTALAGGVKMTKKYTFKEDGINDLDLTIENSTNKELSLDQFYFNFGPGLGTVKSEVKDNGREMKALYTVVEKGHKYPTVVNRGKEKIDATVKDGNWLWAGVNNKYFLAVIIPQNWKSGLIEYEEVIVDKVPSFFGLFGQSEVKGPHIKVDVPAMVLEPKAKTELKSVFYFGPKDYKTLKDKPYFLDRSIEFGFFGALGRLIHSILNRIYKVTGNYGFSIIIVAILFQILMVKFTIMQQKSTITMKKIQPEMKSIQERYKDDKAAQQTALLALYKKHNFNPFMGCLPLLVQLPIFIALFNAFRTSWDLHGAGFVFWITDLSAKDPYYVLPLVMGAVMFFQQRISAPMGSDPAQTAMLKWMPVIFTFVFINFPAGLVLYWLTNSIISFGVQLYMNKKANA